MNNIICHECGTENEPQFCYCKNCGALLKPEAEKQDAKQENSQNRNSNFGFNNSNYGTYNQSVLLDTIDGVPSEDVAVFVGKKSHEIMPKFTKMELSASKISWCWPSAVLGFLFGPLGAAIWFFYRKMYKAALLLVAIGVIASTAVYVIEGPQTDVLSNAYESFYTGDYDSFYSSIEEALDSGELARMLISNAVNFAVRVATMIVTGMFGFYFYKRHSVNSINRYRSMPVDPLYYKMGLYAIGGTSSGMAVLGVFIMMFVTEILSGVMFLV